MKHAAYVLAFVFATGHAPSEIGQQPDAQRYALVVGITGYPHFPSDKRLNFADSDAKLFYDFITGAEAGAFQPRNVRLLQNAQATRTAINEAISWLGSRVSSEDLVYVFFAGHGVVDAQGLAYFMPFDGDPNLPDDRGWRTDEFVKLLHNKMGAATIIFFADACHSGSALSNGFARDGLTNTSHTIKTAWLEAMRNRDSVSMAFLSASANQSSYEDPGLKHGLFSWYLVQGLKGAARANASARIVTAGDAYRYVLDQVEQHASRVLGKKQSPDRSPHFAPTFPLAIASGQEANAAALESRTEEALRLFEDGYTFMQKGREDEAIERFRKVIQLAPDLAEAHVNLGYIYQGRHSLETSIQYYRRALEIDPNLAMANNDLGFTYLLLARFKEAVPHLEKAHDREPSAISALNAGDAYRYTGDVTSALRWHRHVVNVLNDPAISDALKDFYLGTKWRFNFMPVRRGDLDTINLFVDVPDQPGKRAFAHYTLSFDEALGRSFKAADAEFEKAWTFDSAGKYRLYFANRVESLVNMLGLQPDVRQWFDDKRRRLLTQ